MFEKITEQSSHYDHLDKASVGDLVSWMNQEDKKVADAVSLALSKISQLIDAVVDKMLSGGRLFYIGAGTSGRLGVLDASEIPPTYGMPIGLVVGVIAGGEDAITKPIEMAEDNRTQGWEDLKNYEINSNDVVIGLTASGTAPYVIAALEKCKEHQIVTGSISCNPESPISAVADFPVEVVVGPEFVTGSTRMKSGTAQKMVLNMISTITMIQLGRVQGNQMVNMQLTNEKLIDRGVNMILNNSSITSYEEAKKQLLEKGSVKKVIDSL
ncbi:MAG: N-acetylmuramic acid 6-phosphate etherase [Bacteroidia bacterium]|nr:MAG: N-acetylmuramic acid 6-phosphate etherase [Bacteroidia bacterium]